MQYFLGLTILLGKTRCFQEGDLTVCIQIFLVPTKDDDNVGAGQCPSICQPVSQSIVGFSTEGCADHTKYESFHKNCILTLVGK